MKLLFLGSLYPKERYTEISQKSNLLDHAGNALQWSLLNGLAYFFKLQVITVPTTKQSKGLFIKGSFFEHVPGAKDNCIGFCDIIGVKQYFSSKKIFEIAKRDYADIEIIFIYSIQISLLRAAYLLKSENPNIKIIIIVTDLPEYMNDSNNIIYKVSKQIEIKFNKKYLESVDAFVLLSEYMKDKLPVYGKPYILIEGIYNENDDVSVLATVEGSKKIMYSGTLARKYGILNLVQAFMNIRDNSYELIICGDGDSKDEILSLALKDVRIKYKGVLDRNDVIKLQKQADLLVNPRTPEGEYTKYSFPSKTMEYLASGTPVLLYKLPSIPKEYYDYCFTIEDLGVELLKCKLEEIMLISSKDLKEMGDKARNFILQHKTSQQQCAKIYNMLKILQ